MGCIEPWPAALDIMDHQSLALLTSCMEEALQSPEPLQPLLMIARQQAEQGTSQAELYAVFLDRLKRHRGDEALSTALEDVMDLISGWCTPDRRLYD